MYMQVTATSLGPAVAHRRGPNMASGMSEETRRAIGAWLKWVRTSRGLDQAAIATRAGISTTTVKNLEAGRVGRSRLPQSLPRLERALGLPPDTIRRAYETGQPPDDSPDMTRQAVQHEVERRLRDLPISPGERDALLATYRALREHTTPASHHGDSAEGMQAG